MALRHSLVGELPRPRDFDGLERPVLMRPPVTVEFRPGVDMGKVAAQIGALKSVRLDAAVGSGKSTLFPSALAKHVGGVVLHVVPNPLLAKDLYDYVSKQVDAGLALQVPLELWCSPEQDIPRTGVVFMSSADLVSHVIRRGKFDAAANVTVFLDEAHESDACTYLISSLNLNLGMTRLVQASATFGGGDFRARETVGTVEKKTFHAAENPDTWQIDEKGKPWNYATLSDNMLIFVDSRRQAARLCSAYKDVGFLTYRLEHRMSVGLFSEAMRALRDKKGPLVVLVADYSFRSGFTFDVGTVIDSGAVSYYDPTPGAVRILSRPMCEFESEQAAGRAGRIRKGKVVYARPEADFPAQICLLEGVEREAAAYLSRCMGFKPVGVLSSTIMSKEDLPGSVTPLEALNGVYPLTYYVVDSQGRPRSPSVKTEHPTVVIDADRSESPPPKYVDDVDYRAFVASLDNEWKIPEVGQFIKVTGVDAVEPATINLPFGVDSIRRLVEHTGGHMSVKAMSDPDSRYATCQIMNRYNMTNVEIFAMNAILGELAPRSSKLGIAYRQEVKKIFDERGKLVVERQQLHHCLSVLTRDRYDVRSIEPFTHLIKDRLDRYRELFDGGYDSDSESEYVSSMATHKLEMATDHYDRRLDRSGRSAGIGSRSREKVIEFTLPAQSFFSRSTEIRMVKSSSSRTWRITADS